MKLSIVIPCYNEEKNIPILLERFDEVIKRPDVEIIIVNNGSTDNSQNVLRLLAPRYTFLKIVNVAKNQGYGFGILAGLQTSIGEYVGWTHGDLQTSPKDVLSALQIIENTRDPKNIYIKGLRKGRPFFDVFFTAGMSIIESLYLKKGMWDINAQPNIFHRNFYQSWGNPPHDFSLDLYALYLAKKNNFSIIRFDVNFPKRIHGESHWNKDLSSKWKFIKRTIKFSVELKSKL